MEQFGFNNFRKFIEFPQIQLGGINVLVGQNNGGKSTTIKALLLLLENLPQIAKMDYSLLSTNNGSRNYLSFSSSSSKHLKLGNYRSSHNFQNQRDGLSLCFSIGDISLTQNYSASENGERAIMTAQILEIRQFGAIVHISRNNDSKPILGKCVINFREDNREQWINQLKTILTDLNWKIQKHGDNDLSSQVLSRLEDEGRMMDYCYRYFYENFREQVEIENKIGERATNCWELIHTFICQLKEHTEKISCTLEEYLNKKDQDVDEELEKQIIITIELIENIELLIRNGQIDKIEIECIDSKYYHFRIIGKDSYSDSIVPITSIRYILQPLQNKISNVNRLRLTDYCYIETHNAEHKQLLDKEDKNNYLANTIVQYLEVHANNSVFNIRKWLQEFEIGTDFVIEEVEDEAYKVSIIDNQGNCIPLANKGTGSIQMFILLLRLSSALSQTPSPHFYYSVEPLFIIVEEPEQNLHPYLQSKLADLFYEVWSTSQGLIQFVVETHSEYFVRRSQVLVAHHKDSNPFHVYYFPSDGTPYEMKYRTDGNFSNEFGSGFYDEANKLLFEII